ncbi:hypothetical protein I7I51_05009 [Histoplasma capsulatum]|uniref:Uncharacterized protein n=1 Tax=Ajellomyces capsulatus TaxID=5037 RepID=A0A8A1M6W9_AJECA|nr:hypothetical protein I7I51_05009 [Histoplasma capsulatum]
MAKDTKCIESKRNGKEQGGTKRNRTYQIVSVYRGNLRLRRCSTVKGKAAADRPAEATPVITTWQKKVVEGGGSYPHALFLRETYANYCAHHPHLLPDFSFNFGAKTYCEVTSPFLKR